MRHLCELSAAPAMQLSLITLCVAFCLLLAHVSALPIQRTTGTHSDHNPIVAKRVALICQVRIF